MTTKSWGAPSAQWKAWIRALDDAGFLINAVNPFPMDRDTVNAQPYGVVLFDGMIPYLRRYIEYICADCLDMQIIGATEGESFTIKYEVQSLNDAIYISEPMAGDQFAATIQSIVTQQMVA